MDRMEVLRRRNWLTALGFVILVLIGLALFLLLRPEADNKGEISDSLSISKISDSLSDRKDSFPAQSTASSESHSVSIKIKPAQKYVQSRAIPVNGFLDFRKYLNDSLHYPSQAKAAGIEGEVTLSFIVMPDSSIRTICVIKSLTPACDSEAVRLLKNGPKWIPGDSGKPSRQEVEVLFRH